VPPVHPWSDTIITSFTSPRTQLIYKYRPRTSRSRSHHDCERFHTHQGVASNLNRHHLRTFTRTAPANYIDISLNQKWTATTQARTWMQEGQLRHQYTRPDRRDPQGHRTRSTYCSPRDLPYIMRDLSSSFPYRRALEPRRQVTVPRCSQRMGLLGTNSREQVSLSSPPRPLW
jgi:hypothetical protein